MPGGPIPWIPPIYQPFLDPDNFSELTPAERNCTHGISWIWIVMGQCVMDVRGIFALIAGFVCIIMWIITGVPQVIENCRKGLPDKALSPLLLTFWTLGDLSNFIGCILAHQLILQVVVSAYSIANDLVLVVQFIYYKVTRQILVEKVTEALGSGQILPEEDSPDMHSPLLEGQPDPLYSDSPTIVRSNPTRRLAVCFLCIMGFVFSQQILNSNQGFLSERPAKLKVSSMEAWQSRRLLQWNEPSVISNKLGYSNFLDDPVFRIGYAFGWVSSICYLCSRFPQIFQNWKRKSTEGLCLIMFCFTVLGNSSYGLQIFLTSMEPSYLLRSLPWLIGSLGIIALDFMAILTKREACEAWRARDCLTSSLVAVFPAAMIGRHITVTLLNETRVTGRLSSCDGMLNLEFDGDVVIRTPNPGQMDRITHAKSLTIFGRRIRYISLPSSLNIHETLQAWDEKSMLSNRMIPRPTRAKDKYDHLRQSTVNQPESLQNLIGQNCASSQPEKN